MPRHGGRFGDLGQMVEKPAGMILEGSVNDRGPGFLRGFLTFPVMRQPTVQQRPDFARFGERGKHREQFVAFASWVAKKESAARRQLDFAWSHRPAGAQLGPLRLPAVQVERRLTRLVETN